jgi:hypothetical protein
MQIHNFKFSKLTVMFFLLAFGILKPALAADPNPSGLTGQYSCVMNRQHGPFNANLMGAGGVGILITGFFDYAKKSGSLLLTLVDNFGTKGITGEQVAIDFVFSETKHAKIPNKYVLTALIDNEYSSFLVMPVNSKNTLLITSADFKKAPWTGVCQKV